jgi:hypothetical protein
VVDMQRIPREHWQPARAAYLARVRPWAEDRLRRMSRQQKHPVHDFLFEYYSFRPAHLCRWTPGFGVVLEGATHEDLPWGEFVTDDSGLSLPAARVPGASRAVPCAGPCSTSKRRCTASRRSRAWGCTSGRWSTATRTCGTPTCRCGLSRDAIDAVIDSQPLRCSHYDAFRFFTPAAAPRNRWQLTRAATTEHDQPGCIHVTMDLYRFAYKIAPFCPADVLADAFELAAAAREVDMRASPYDLTGYGFDPIRIETREGREEYVELQREISPARNRFANGCWGVPLAARFAPRSAPPLSLAGKM